jgi:hypothetical protein
MRGSGTTVAPEQNTVLLQFQNFTVFCSALQRNFMEFVTKSNSNCLRLFCRAKTKLELRTKAPYFVLPRSEFFGMANKSTVFCSLKSAVNM